MKRWCGQAFQTRIWRVAIQTAAISWLLLGLGARGFNLLEPQGLSLTKDIYENDDAICDKSTALRAAFDSFWLPKSPEEFTLTIFLEDLKGASSNGILVNLEGAILQVDAEKGKIFEWCSAWALDV